MAMAGRSPTSRPSGGLRRPTDGAGRPELPYVVCLSDPPTPKEQLLLAACRLMRKPIAIMPAKCETVEEWVARHARR